MPGYFLQTLGGKANSADWDFKRWTPDAVVINLGTNDFGKDSGPAWEAAFTAAFITFVKNITATYGEYRPWRSLMIE